MGIKQNNIGLFAKLSFGRVNESAIQKNPEQSLQCAEEQIDADFSNITAHKTLALAAKQLGLVETALLGYEYLFNLDQTNASNGKHHNATFSFLTTKNICSVMAYISITLKA